MTEPQIIRSSSGDELVVLPRADYEALLARAEAAAEDEDDIAIYDARKAALAAGLDSLLPPAVSAAVLQGSSLLRAIRLWRGRSQANLAERTGLAQGYLSDLENRRRAGSAETFEKLALALDVPAAWLRPFAQD